MAGTSVQTALSTHCSDGDHVTGIRDYFDPSVEASTDTVKDLPSYKMSPDFNHTYPNIMKKKIPKIIWRAYTKITIVRNPWDFIVSYCCWRTYRKFINDFHDKVSYEFLNKYSQKKDFIDNDRFCFDEDGNPIMDYYIRYENLQKDFDMICDKLKIPRTKLLRLKDKIRKNKMHYSHYYDSESEEWVRNRFEHYINYFNYSFDRVSN